MEAGVVQPGHAVHPGGALLAAHVPPSPQQSDVPEPLVRYAKTEDVGIVHKVVITTGNDQMCIL